MSSKDITTDELLETHMAGGRQNEEESKALEAWKYRNPLDWVEFPSERARKEEMRRQEKAKRKGRK